MTDRVACLSTEQVVARGLLPYNINKMKLGIGIPLAELPLLGLLLDLDFIPGLYTITRDLTALPVTSTGNS